MIRLLNNRLVFVFSCLLFRVMLDLAYALFVSKVFYYEGYHFEPSASNYLLSWLVYGFCAILVRHVLYVISDYFMVTFLLAVMAPMSSMIGLGNYELSPFFVTTGVFLFFKLVQYGGPLSQLMPPPKLPQLARGRKVSLYIAFAAVVFLVSWYFASGAVMHFNLDFSKVYDYRAKSSELANVGVLAYLNNWVYSVFTIFLIAYSLYKRNFVLFWVLFVVQIFFYGVSNHKSVFFAPVMVFGVWYYFRNYKSLTVMPIGFLFIVGLTLGAYLYLGDVMMASMFIRRVFYVPSMLAFDYFEFFSNNQFVYWSNSILSGFLDYPYEDGVGRVIGEFNGSGAGANNGFISSGYAHAGILGVMIYSVVLSYFLKVVDSAVNNSDIPVWLAVCMMLVPLRSTLISSDLLTTMLTHGLLLSLIMLLLFRDSRIQPV